MAFIGAGFEDCSIRLWDVTSAQEVRTFRGGHKDAIRSIAFHPSGRLLASVSLDALMIWDITNFRYRIYVVKRLARQQSPSNRTATHSQPVTGNRSSGSGNRGRLQTARDQSKRLQKFFNLVGTLTDRDDLDFIRVTEDFRIIVITADVATGVPMEVLSQGMTSLLGWVGVLCQRLKETLQTTTDDPLPTHSFALVLIDELDAHMHPRWQQVLVHRLKQAFPNVQFIANTHSPLIVSGLEKDEVSRFAIADGKIGLVRF